MVKGSGDRVMHNSFSCRVAQVGALVIIVGCATQREERDLAEVAFAAFVDDSPETVPDLVMNESRYRAMTAGDDRGMTGQEHENAIEEASARAAESASRTFGELRRLLVASGFDWSSARVVRVETVVRQGMMGTVRVPFDALRTEQRLDLHLVIESGGKAIELKLDDCFLVDGARYIGDGFRLQTWSGFELDAATLAEISARN